jgi:ribosomal-protein-alanine N-acetyltransferase
MGGGRAGSPVGDERMRIETERLILREFVEADWPAILAYWRDPRYLRFYQETKDRESAVRELISRFVAAQTEEPRLVWQLAITDPLSGRLIGNCGIRVKDPVRREANIGYELDPNVWGHGYATEAARAILRFGFETLGMHRVWAECVADNTGSWRVMERLGMRQEARFREHQWFRDRWWDTLIYAILDHEWTAVRERASP